MKKQNYLWVIEVKDPEWRPLKDEAFTNRADAERDAKWLRRLWDCEYKS